MCLWLAHWWFGPIRYLQFHASNIRDDYDDSGAGFTGDFTRTITASCTEEVFHRYAAQQNLKERFASNPTSGEISVPRGGFLPSDLTGAYFLHELGGKDVVLAYKDGKLYYYINVY